MFKYLRERKNRKLYQQWVDKAELPPEEVPQEEEGDASSPLTRLKEITELKDAAQFQLPMLYIMQGVSLLLLLVILIILLVHAC